MEAGVRERAAAAGAIAACYHSPCIAGEGGGRRSHVRSLSGLTAFRHQWGPAKLHPSVVQVKKPPALRSGSCVFCFQLCELLEERRIGRREHTGSKRGSRGTCGIERDGERWAGGVVGTNPEGILLRLRCTGT